MIEKKKSAVPSLMFLTEKWDKTVKARECTDGQKQRGYIPKDSAASPIMNIKIILITAVIEAREECEIAVMDLPGALLHAKNEREVTMKMEGKLE